MWVPTLYTIHAMYLVEHAPGLPIWLALTLFALGIISVKVNYDADAQRQNARKYGSKYKIWGSPIETIMAEYDAPEADSDQVVRKESLLLCSGYWGIARHFHYLPEIVAAICWSM